MAFTQSKIWLPVILFVCALAFGLWLNRSGRPLNILVFTIHKLIALAGVIFTAIAVYNWLKSVDIQAMVILPIILLVLCVLALFISGAFLSRETPVNKTLLTLHKISPVVTVLSAGYIIYLMVG